MSAAPDAANASGAIRASVVGAAAPYQMFDVESIDVGGARLIAPLLLEIGEEITLRVERGDARAEVRARVTAVERGDPGLREAVSIVEFVDDDPAPIRAVLDRA